MMTVDTLSVPYQPHLRSPSPPAPLKPTPKLQVQTAQDNRSRRRHPDRPAVSSASTALVQPADNLYCLRPMQADDLPAVKTLMTTEGWNIDFDNLEIVFRMCPQAYLVAQSLSGHIVGHISGTPLSEDVGVLSYVIVSRRHQKRGLGRRLMKMAVEALNTKTITFYSLEDAVTFHKSCNFETRRFSTLVRDFCLDPEDFGAVEEKENVRVVKAQEADFLKLKDYDTAVHGVERADYLSRWIISSDKVAYAAMDSTSGDVLGYISLSHHDGRWDVTPLYADSDDVALQLLRKASLDIGEAIRVFVRIPADSSDGIKLFNSFRDLQHHRVLYLMANQPLSSNFTSDKIYSLSTVCYGLK